MTSSISAPTPTPVPFPVRIFAPSDSSPLFGVQDALSTYSGFNNTYLPSAEQGSGILFRSGCVIDGILNCTAACQDPNQIFTNPHTLQNCMVMASLWFLKPALMSYPLVLYGSRDFQRPFYLTIDSSSTALLEEFSIHTDEHDFQVLASGVNRTIQDCLYQYLDKYPSFEDDDLDDDPDEIETWGPWYFDSVLFMPTASKYNAYIGFPSVCNNVLAPLNADVGGIWVRKAMLFKKIMLIRVRFTSPTGFKAASPSQLF